MRGLFCCDWYIYKDNEGNYYDITLTKEVLDRYLKIVDQLFIAIRVKQIEDRSLIKNYSKLPSEKVHIYELPDILSPKGIIFEQKRTKQLLNNVVENSDLIFVRLPSLVGNKVIKIAKEKGKPYLSEVGGCAWDSYWNHSIKGKVLAPYMFFNMRKVVRGSHFTSYVTEKFLQKRYPTNGQTCSCSNVVLKQCGDINILKNRLKKIEKFDKKKPVIIGTTAAVNVKYKGQQYVIKAISKLNSKGYNLHYHLVGSGDNSYLKRVAKKYGVLDKVHFLGVMKHEDVLSWLEEIDIYVQPSKQEGLPRALIEAMSKGCPAIGSTTAGIPELLNNSMIFNNGNVNQICEKLEYLINSRDFMKEQATLNFNKAKEYDYKIIEERRFKFFKKYLKTVASFQ